MSYRILFLSFLLSSSLFLISCGGGSAPEGEEAISLSGTSIPVLQTDKSRKADLKFDLTEVVLNGDEVTLRVFISNTKKKDPVKVNYLKDEMALTDNNGFIYRPSSASIGSKKQWGSDDVQVEIEPGGKIRSSLIFENVKPDASSADLFYKGESDREGKVKPFDVNFKKVKIKS